MSVFVTVSGAAGCGDSNVETVDRSQVASKQEAPSPKAAATSDATSDVTGRGAIAGVSWTIPAGWETGPDRPMRVATYWVGTGSVKGDCAVFFFGPGQGGSVQDNIDRWIGQFVQPDGAASKEKAAIKKETVAGLQVTTIDLSGTYIASMGGPMSSQKEERPDYRMLGAIVEAPEGPVFFKLTGPEGVVMNSFDDFRQLVESVSKT